VTVIDRPDTDCMLGVRASTTMGEVVNSTGFVVKQATSLADLYRKAKKKGVLTARSQYQ